MRSGARPIFLPDSRATSGREDSAPATRIATDLAGLFHGVEARMSKASVRLPAAALDRYVGAYAMGPNELVLTRQGDRLFATIPGRPPLELAAEADGRFFARTAEVSLAFVTGPGGEVVDGAATVGARQVPLRRKVK